MSRSSRGPCSPELWSNRFITLVVPPSSRQSTPVIKKSLNPVYPPKDSTFDFPLYLSLASLVGGRGLEGVIWDKVSESIHRTDY